MRGFQAAALLGLLALPAKADIVDSGSLQIVGQGIIGGTMTVQGNALGVAGSVLATSATLSGTGAQVYSLTTSSGIHLINGKLRFEAGGMIEWADLTKSTTASAGASGPIFNSTSVIRTANVSFTNNTFQCLSGSTLTMTTTGGDIAVFMSATVQNTTSGIDTQLGFLQDGAWVNGAPALINWTQVTGGYNLPASFFQVVRGVSAASHSWCLAAQVSNYTSYLIGDPGTRKNVFGVLELK